ncbi:MAG: isopenicillin N synthase family dioxygenase [Acidimicrobiales bacterium]
MTPPDRHRGPGTGEPLPLIDVSGLVSGGPGAGRVAREIDRACRDHGFFRIVGHGVDRRLLGAMDRHARDFFGRTDDEKASVAMAAGGAAWRGWFPLGGELTSGRPDRKEGLYVGLEHGPDHPRVRSGTPLHGANRFPEDPAGLGPAVLAWLDRLIPLAHALMRGIAAGLGLRPDWFERHVTSDPTVLFRIFRYPPQKEGSESWGVAEHTDYGLLTILAQDDRGGLQVRSGERWLDVPAEPGVLVCNIGDMLDRLTEGRYRSTPHRVRNSSGASRLSFPFFFDPSWDAVVTPLPLEGAPPADDAARRWDGTSVHAWQGSYGDYLTAKVARVFPELFAAVGDR